MQRLTATLNQISAPDQAIQQQAREREAHLTKPPGSLGQLEAIAVQLAGIAGTVRPVLRQKALVIMAGDHGVTAEGVSAYPAEVTAQMVANFLAGGAAINALARGAGARLTVVNLGVAGQIPQPATPAQDAPRLVERRLAAGTANAAQGPAMSREQAVAAIDAGLDILAEEVAQGLDLLGVGEMGIGNTTAASALVAALTGQPVASVTGPGTGISHVALQRKIVVVEQMLAVNQVTPDDPLGLLAAVGGLEIAGLVGLLLGAAAARVPVVLDGFITGAAALVAVALCPAVQPYLIAGHRSPEPGHLITLQHLGLTPLLDLGLRLGEGSGAALAFGVVDGAARHLTEMATFAEAGVTDR